MTKLSIIFPVYNVELFVRAGLESFFIQGLDDIDSEVIIVNNSSTDRSMEMTADILMPEGASTEIFNLKIS
jgi:glycosyltransferase involved in cell wall biosynthesis